MVVESDLTVYLKTAYLSTLGRSVILLQLAVDKVGIPNKFANLSDFLSGMGWFNFLFGAGSDQFSSQARALSELEIHHLVSRAHFNSLSASDQQAIYEAILHVRGGDGFVSLRQIDQALQRLVTQGKISKNDHWAVRDAFKNFFTQQ